MCDQEYCTCKGRRSEEEEDSGTVRLLSIFPANWPYSEVKKTPTVVAGEESEEGTEEGRDG